jgi:hypothetical protein
LENSILIYAQASYNSHFASKNKKFKLIVNKNVRPCFFSGDIETKGKIVTISLNPKYTTEYTENEQANMSFVEWYDFCRFRFERYESPSIHKTFNKLFKAIAPTSLWQNIDKRNYLQDNVVNIDWCFYFSQNFPTIDFDKMPEDLCLNIHKAWDENLNWLISKNNPRHIFAHGKSIQHWIAETSNKTEHIMEIKSRRGNCSLLRGEFMDTKIPIFYLTHSVINVNENLSFEKISNFINGNSGHHR